VYKCPEITLQNILPINAGFIKIPDHKNIWYLFVGDILILGKVYGV
jgi:hypothetical protein